MDAPALDSSSLAHFPPLGLPLCGSPKVCSDGPGSSKGGLSPCGDLRVSEGPVRNVAFELLDEELRKTLSHLQFVGTDDASTKQIKALSAENLVLRQQAELYMSKSLLEGQSSESPKPVVSNFPTPWKNLLVEAGCDDACTELQFFPPSMEAGKIVVSPPPSIGQCGAKKWQSSLVGYFLDKTVPFMAVKSIVFKIWGKFGITDVLSNADGFYFFLFNKDNAYRQILDSGPCHIGGRLMILKKWEPQMNLVKDQLMKIPIWVQFFNVPLEYWTSAGLSYIASAVGRPLFADSMTERCKRLNYARICVEIEVGAHLPLSFGLRFDNGKEVEIRVQYPWKPLQCMDCMVFGHNEAGCPKNPLSQAHTSTTTQVWVAKAGKGKESVVPTTTGPGTVTGHKEFVQVSTSPSNRFAVLESIILESDDALGFVEPASLSDVVTTPGVQGAVNLNDQGPPGDVSCSGMLEGQKDVSVQPLVKSPVLNDTKGNLRARDVGSGQLNADQQVQPSFGDGLDPSGNQGSQIDFGDAEFPCGMNGSQSSQIDVRDVEFPTGMNGGPEPPKLQRKSRKPNRKR